MAPLLVLVVITALARTVGWLGVTSLANWPMATTVGLVAMFCLTASAHFIQPRRDRLIAMVPTRTRRAHQLVTTTGVLELAGAIGLLLPATRLAAATCLALLLIVMFPANVHAARSDPPPAGPPVTPLGRRAAYQGVFLAACAIATLTLLPTGP